MKFLSLTSKRAFNFLTLGGVTILLSACAGMGAPPACPDGTGLTCAGVNDIDHLVDTGRIRTNSGFDQSGADTDARDGAGDGSSEGIAPVSDTESTSGDRVSADTDTDDNGRAWLTDSKSGYSKNYGTPYGSNFYQGEPLRYGETVLHIWVAPYEDKADNYHEATFLDAVVKKGFWIGHPPRA